MLKKEGRCDRQSNSPGQLRRKPPPDLPEGRSLKYVLS